MDEDECKPEAEKTRSSARIKHRQDTEKAATIDMTEQLPSVEATATSAPTQSTTDEENCAGFCEPKEEAERDRSTSEAKKAAAVIATADERNMEPKEDEVRAARHRSTCPWDLRVRLERASTQRLYLIQQSDVPAPEDIASDSRVDFTVLGSTGNVYTVSLKLQPSCTCPDFCRRRDMCKHIMFVLLKVVGLDVDNELSYQEAYIPSELKALFGILRERRVGGSTCGSVMANDRVRAAVAAAEAAATSGSKDGVAGDASSVTGLEEVKGVERRALQEGDADCPICFDDLSDEPQDTLTYCRSTCGANFHKACITRWLSVGRSSSSGENCPNCRQAWWSDVDGTDPNSKHSRKRVHEGYMNVGALQGMSRQRDTSTYY